MAEGRTGQLVTGPDIHRPRSGKQSPAVNPTRPGSQTALGPIQVLLRLLRDSLNPRAAFPRRDCLAIWFLLKSPFWLPFTGPQCGSALVHPGHGPASSCQTAASLPHPDDGPPAALVPSTASHLSSWFLHFICSPPLSDFRVPTFPQTPCHSVCFSRGGTSTLTFCFVPQLATVQLTVTLGYCRDTTKLVVMVTSQRTAPPWSRASNCRLQPLMLCSVGHKVWTSYFRKP